MKGICVQICHQPTVGFFLISGETFESGLGKKGGGETFFGLKTLSELCPFF